MTRAGEVWTAWQAYQDRGDHVYVRRGASAPERITTTPGDVYRTSIAEDPEGRIHVAWSERHGTDWNLFERVFDGRNWSGVTQLTHANVPNIFPSSPPVRTRWRWCGSVTRTANRSL